MILVVDIGNTNIKFGIYRDHLQLHQWRISTDIRKTRDEYLNQIEKFLTSEKIDPKHFEKTIISSVVPHLISVIQYVILKLTNKECLVVDHTSFADMPILTDYPSQVGTDRLVNAFAGYHLYHSAIIIIDCGTATTFDVVDDNGAFQGGVISPGLLLSLQALTKRTSKLPGIKLEQPKNVIGKNTNESMQSGIIFGYAGLVDSIVNRICQEMKSPAKVIATGGLARILLPVSERIEEVIDDLTLRGLYLISQKKE